MTKESVVSVRLPTDLKEAIDRLAEADRRPTSSYIKIVLEDHVREKKASKKKG